MNIKEYCETMNWSHQKLAEILAPMLGVSEVTIDAMAEVKNKHDLFVLFCLAIAELGRLRVYLDDAEGNYELNERIMRVFSDEVKKAWFDGKSNGAMTIAIPLNEAPDRAAEHLHTLERELCQLFGVDELEIFDFQLKHRFLVDGIMRF